MGMMRFCQVSSSTVGTMEVISERPSEAREQYQALYRRLNTLDESQMATVTWAKAPARAERWLTLAARHLLERVKLCNALAK